GGGYMISFTDFSECISDGETIAAAIDNGMDALQETIAALESLNIPVPEPGSGGKLIQRLPKTVHSRLVKRAKQEGVSMSSLVFTDGAQFALGVERADNVKMDY
ncbi:MAG: type II toxin-antitoxin system HicB family antitoxin, partial [Chlorobium sp.]